MNQNNNKRGGNPSQKQKSGRQVRQNPPVNRLIGRDQRINLERLVLSQLARQPIPQKRGYSTYNGRNSRSEFLSEGPRQRNQLRDQTQLGAVVRTRLTKMGLSDIRSHRVTWVIGYTYVGDGTKGTANSVYFLPISAGTPTWLIKGQAAGSSGQVPILASDPDLGATYVSDVEKHYARKIIRRMWLHVDSLQPSTSNNMMCVIAPSRGPGGGSYSIPITYATAAVTANTVANVSSMKGAKPVDSWESKTLDITEFIAGGSGVRQNEFEIEASLQLKVYITTAVVPSENLEGLVPACFAIAGNNTTAALQGTNVHQISVEQEIDLIDFVGGMAQPEPSA